MAINDPDYRYATQTWEADGIRILYEVAFDGGYIRQSDVIAYSTLVDPETSMESDQTPLDLEFLSETFDDITGWKTAQVRILPAVEAGRSVVIQRNTQKSAPLVNFVDGSILTQANLDLANQQSTFGIAEIADQMQAAINLSRVAYDVVQGVVGEDVNLSFLASKSYVNTRVTYQIAGTNTVTRTVAQRAADVVTVQDYGIVGIGDETTKLQNLLNEHVGKVIRLEPSLEYTVTALDIPAGTILQTRGAIIKRVAPSTSPIVTINSDVLIDSLHTRVAGGHNDCGVRVKGDNVAIDFLKVYSPSISTGYGGYQGVFFGGEGGVQISNIRVGRIEVDNFDSAIYSFNTTETVVDFVRIRNYVYGWYARDMKNAQFHGGHLSGVSPTATGGPGNNGFLLEAYTASFSTDNVSMYSWRVEDSAEHAFRVGGQWSCANLFFTNCSSRNTGSLIGVSTGGAGFKCLGGYINGTFHYNVMVDNFVAEDCSVVGSGIGNFTALQLGTCRGVRVNNFTVRKRNNPHSCWWGLSVGACEDVQIINPNITGCKQHAAKFLSFAGTVPPYSTLLRDVSISGGHLDADSTNSHCVVFECGGDTFDNVTLDNSVLVTGGVAGVAHTAPTTGAYTNNRLNIVRLRSQNTGSTPPTSNQNNVLVEMVGPMYGSFIMQGMEGSTVIDPTTGLKQYRYAGAWRPMPMGGVASRFLTGNITLALSDAGQMLINGAAAGAKTVLIPTNTAVALPIGTLITITNSGGAAGNITINPDAGVTLYSNGVSGSVVVTQGNSVTLQKVSTNLWQV